MKINVVEKEVNFDDILFKLYKAIRPQAKHIRPKEAFEWLLYMDKGEYIDLENPVAEALGEVDLEEIELDLNRAEFDFCTEKSKGKGVEAFLAHFAQRLYEETCVYLTCVFYRYHEDLQCYLDENPIKEEFTKAPMFEPRYHHFLEVDENKEKTDLFEQYYDEHNFDKNSEFGYMSRKQAIIEADYMYKALVKIVQYIDKGGDEIAEIDAIAVDGLYESRI